MIRCVSVITLLFFHGLADIDIHSCRGWCAGGGPVACAVGRPAASSRTLNRAPGHPDKGMKPAVGEVLEALNLLETGPLVHGDRPVVERSHGEGIALRPERR